MNKKKHIDTLLPTAHSGFCVAPRVEPEWLASAQTYIGITENTFTPSTVPPSGLLESILSSSNLNAAYKQVKSNAGSGGIDGMKVNDLLPYLLNHKEELVSSLYGGRYVPNPVRRVEIPKSNGKLRSLGIPTVVDRLIQQAIAQILTPIFDVQFSDHSYGFRAGRSAHGALSKCLSYLNSGYEYVVDLDLECFFDTVNHSKLIEVLSRTIKDGRVISLIHKYLNAGIMVKGKRMHTSIGVPQGSPLSPLLSNILLNELDKELEARGHLYVRYADDLVIFCKSLRSAERTLSHLLPFIEKKLFLKVNQAKTQVSYFQEVSFLSYSFSRTNHPVYLRVSAAATKKMKDHIRELTSRNKGWSYAYRKQRLRWYIRGWVNYFRLAEMNSYLRKIDSWLRHRIRSFIWRSWKRVRTRYRNLKKILKNEKYARLAAYSRKQCWRMGNNQAVKGALSINRLREAGYLYFSDHYKLVKV